MEMDAVLQMGMDAAHSAAVRQERTAAPLKILALSQVACVVTEASLVPVAGTAALKGPATPRADNAAVQDTIVPLGTSAFL